MDGCKRARCPVYSQGADLRASSVDVHLDLLWCLSPCRHVQGQQKAASGLSSSYCAKSLQSCLTLCDPTDCSPPGSSVPGILQARILQWVAMPSSRGSSRPRDGIHVSYAPALAGGFFTTGATWGAHIHTGKLLPFESFSHQQILLLPRQMLHTVAANV